MGTNIRISERNATFQQIICTRGLQEQGLFRIGAGEPQGRAHHKRLHHKWQLLLGKGKDIKKISPTELAGDM
jgi:hypothetical protein